jgi:hypothetical protein
MADAIRTAPRENRVLPGPAITFAIAEEINLLKQEAEHRVIQKMVAGMAVLAERLDGEPDLEDAP